ncbi:PREDICTED: methylesterase 10 [Ipomoea nil]|uniref:methylesterase 10 n=1 Tax=Ipomoea nil TaxID=35883 RepID=UPI00090193B3|nr:PREDICTED: methylesterase 10 [Ipomoea nil]
MSGLKQNKIMEGNNKKHIVLVHGICHGAWCWYKVVTLLRLSGHRVTALDLGACGVHPRQLKEIATAADYVQPLMELLGNLPRDEKVVLVGHSYGGLPISLAMQSFPNKILVAVFLAAYMPNHYTPPATLIQEYFRRTRMETLMDCQLTFDKGLQNPPTSVIFGSNFMEAMVYTHCKPEDLELGRMLIRPGALFVEEMAKENLLTKDKYGSVKRVYIICEDDQIMDQEFQIHNIQNSPPCEVKSMAATGHMAMLSKPEELCFSLQEIIDDANMK